MTHSDERVFPSLPKDDPIWNDPNWVAEEKYNGRKFRLEIQAKLPHKLISNGAEHDRALCFPQVAFARLPLLPAGTILEGEVMIPGGDSSDVAFMASNPLPRVEQRKVAEKALFMVFDILQLGDDSFLDAEYFNRRKALEIGFKNLTWPGVFRLSERRDGLKQKYFEEIIARGGEGVMLKDKWAKYGKGIVKGKKTMTFDVVIMSFTKSTSAKNKDLFGAVKFGVYKDGELIECGQCSGMNDEVRKELHENREKYIGTVIEVKGQEPSKFGRIQHPRFIGWRNDKQAEQQTWETQIAPYMKKKE